MKDSNFNSETYGIPRIYYKGTYFRKKYNIMIMTTFERTLEQEFEKLGPFRQKTVLMIGIKMVIVNFVSVHLLLTFNTILNNF